MGPLSPTVGVIRFLGWLVVAVMAVMIIGSATGLWIIRTGLRQPILEMKEHQ